MKRILFALAALVLIAATTGEVVPELETRGYFIETGSNATEEVVGDAVAEAGFAGGRLYIVVLAEEPPSGATFFSDAVLDELGEGTVLTVAPETVGYASDGGAWSQDQLDAAVDASLSGSSDDDVVSGFVESLTGADIGGGPGPVEQPGSSGSGSGWVWLLVIGGGFLLLFLYLRSRSNRVSSVATAGRLKEFRSAAQAKLDAVANDILEMEDEVRLSENAEIQQHYNSASAKYAEVIDSIDKVSDPEKLLDLTYVLDVAIWELDVAEALLDGKKPPEKPEKPEVKMPTPGPEGPDEPVLRQPQPATYDRRPQRQSSPAGPDLGSILLAILAARGMGGQHHSGGWTGAPTPGGGGLGRMRGGGGRIRGGGRRRG